MKTLARLVAVLLALGAIARSQEATNSPSERGTLEGTVINIQNERVVPRSTVVARNLRRVAEARSVRCDGEGHFLMKNVEPGSYRLSAEHQSYFSSTRHQVFQYRVDLMPGQQLGNIMLYLQPAAVVTGQVNDENTDPMQNVRIELFDRLYRNGRIVLERVGTAVTDDRGIYRISDVHPGSYYLVAEVQRGAKPVTAAAGPRPAVETPTESDIAYAPLFYPDATDFPQAQVLPVAAGEETHANFAFAAKPSVSIHGKVVHGVTGEPAPSASVAALWTEYVDTSGVNARSLPEDGSFELRGLAPGVYTLRAAFSIEGMAYSTQRHIEVGPLGMENIILDALPDTAIAGLVHLDVTDPGQAAPPSLNVEFQSNTSAAHSSAVATVRAGAPAGSREYSFQAHLHPGEQYTARVRGLPENDYLKSVQVNGHPVERNEVTASEQRADIELGISPSGGYIEGLVLDESGQPMPGSVVVLVPDESRLDQADLFRRAASDKQGRFSMRGVVPGAYQLLAFDDVDLNELISQPETLKRFADRAVAVNVEEQMDYATALKIIRGSEEIRPTAPQSP